MYSLMPSCALSPESGPMKPILTLPPPPAAELEPPPPRPPPLDDDLLELEQAASASTPAVPTAAILIR